MLPVHNGTSCSTSDSSWRTGRSAGCGGGSSSTPTCSKSPTSSSSSGHFLTVLEAAAANPTTPISKLPLLPPAERQRIVHEWNDTADDYPAADRLPDAFARQAAADPGRPGRWCRTARRSPTASSTSGRTGWPTTCGAGVKPRDLVGVCLKRSADMVAARPGRHQVRGRLRPARLRLPEGPPGLHARGLEGPAGPDPGALLDRLPARRPAGQHRRDRSRAGPATPSPTGAIHTPDAVAYVIYTSGSTGKPKGVVVRHRAAVNTIDWVNRTFGVGPRTGCCSSPRCRSTCRCTTSSACWGRAAAAGRRRARSCSDPARLARDPRTEPITMWDSAPAALQQLVPFFAAQAGRPATCGCVMLSGDWIPVPLPDQIRKSFPERAGHEPGRGDRGGHLVELVPGRARSTRLAEHPVRQADPQRPLPHPGRRPRSRCPVGVPGRALHRRASAWPTAT